jgi:DNA-binding transcriptional regulator YiaG
VANVMGVLRTEIRRLARKETREAVRELKRQVAALRRRLAATKKRITDVERVAQRAGSSRAAAPARAEVESGGQVRFSPRWVKVHRGKLGMSRRVYAKLVGVSPQTILLWETDKARPRRGTLATWRALRAKGIRELKALVSGEGGRKRGRKPGPKARGPAKAAGRGRAAGARRGRPGRPSKKKGAMAKAARRAAPRARRAKARTTKARRGTAKKK